jgi:hypothetical protein
MKTRLVCFVLAGLFFCSPALADEGGWEYTLTPYLWFAGLKGDVATVPPLPPAPIDVSSSDALSDTEASLMVNFGAKKNRHGMFLGFVYSDVQQGEELVPPPIDLMLKSTTKSTLLSAAYQYEFYRNGNTVFDVLAGGRYWKIDSKLQFGGGLGILEGVELKHKESWVDPAVGIKGITRFGSDSRIYLTGVVAVGGFGVGSDHFYDFNVNLGYQWSKSIGTAIGYRVFDVDYEKKDFLYDVKQPGWLLSLTWAF